MEQHLHPYFSAPIYAVEEKRAPHVSTRSLDRILSDEFERFWELSSRREESVPWRGDEETFVNGCITGERIAAVLMQTSVASAYSKLGSTRQSRLSIAQFIDAVANALRNHSASETEMRFFRHQFIELCEEVLRKSGGWKTQLDPFKRARALFLAGARFGIQAAAVWTFETFRAAQASRPQPADETLLKLGDAMTRMLSDLTDLS
jgi:hypothetical protein